MALVESPRALDGDPEPVGGVEGEVRGLDRAAEHGGVQHVGQEAGFGEQFAAADGFGLALLGEPHIDPSGEEVELVPDALAVAEEDQRVGRGHCPMIATSTHRPRRRRAGRDWHHGRMSSGRSPVGQITRGTTGTNRLRRVDRWIARHPALRRAADPLVVDLGFGASAVTALELHARLARARPDVEVVGLEIDPSRVARARASARGGARRVQRRSRRMRACRSPSAGSRCRRRGRRRGDPRDERAAAVRRGGGARRLATHVRAARAGRSARRGDVRRTRPHRARGWRSGRMPRPRRSRSRCGSRAWSIRRSRRSDCRRRSSTGTFPASACTRSSVALDDEWERAAGHVAVRSGAAVGGARSRRCRTAGWPVQERSRWRLGEVTVPWSAVAPL